MLGTSSGDPGTTGPFSVPGCAPAEHCGTGRKPVHVSKTLVRPGKKNGGTSLVFSLKEGALVRFTIVRVYPSCKRIGSFSVHAHEGVNRVRFGGRWHGRVLPSGTYRVLVHAQGQERAAAAVTIVVMGGQAKPSAVRRAQAANACSPEQAREIENAAAAEFSGRKGSGGSPLAEPAKAISRAVVGAVKGVAARAQALNASIDEHFPNPVVQTLVGLLTLLSACLGALVLTRLRSRVRH